MNHYSRDKRFEMFLGFYKINNKNNHIHSTKEGKIGKLICSILLFS